MDRRSDCAASLLLSEVFLACEIKHANLEGVLVARLRRHVHTLGPTSKSSAVPDWTSITLSYFCVHVRIREHTEIESNKCQDRVPRTCRALLLRRTGDGSSVPTGASRTSAPEGSCPVISTYYCHSVRNYPLARIFPIRR